MISLYEYRFLKDKKPAAHFSVRRWFYDCLQVVVAIGTAAAVGRVSGAMGMTIALIMTIIIAVVPIMGVYLGVVAVFIATTLVGRLLSRVTVAAAAAMMRECGCTAQSHQKSSRRSRHKLFQVHGIHLPSFLNRYEYPGLNDILMDAGGQIVFVTGNGKGHGNIIGFQQLYQLLNKKTKSDEILAANLENAVYKNLGDVVVASEKAGKEAVKSVEARYMVIIDVDQAYLMGEVEFQRIAFFHTNNVALRGFHRFGSHLDQRFCFAGAFVAHN